MKEEEHFVYPPHLLSVGARNREWKMKIEGKTTARSIILSNIKIRCMVLAGCWCGWLMNTKEKYRSGITFSFD